MIRDVDLVAYLPPFIAEYQEINITLAAENPEFGLVWKAADRALGNEFIATADEYGIGRFEKILGIYPSDTDTLEARRMRVQNKWFNAAPYTIRMLAAKMTELLGGARFFSIWTDPQNGYELRLTIYNTEDPRFESYHMEEAKYLLGVMVPLNMRYRLNDQIGIEIDCRALERFVLQRINIHIDFPFFLCRMLDGTWMLDGEICLCQKRRYQLMLRTKNALLIQNAQGRIEADSGLQSKLHMEQSVCAAAGIHMEIQGEQPEEKNGVRIRAEIGSGCGDIGELVITNKTKDFWTLNGGIMLDGSRCLDSVFIREEI